VTTTTLTPTDLAGPVSEDQRIRLVDALRGIAVLGILLMNIPLFAMPEYFSESFRSDPANVNFWVNAVITVIFEGKMRALFGMLFGAGVLLFVIRKERAGVSTTGRFYQRMGWLVAFGLLHAHVILWQGDILYLYGLCGMLVYLFRNVNPKYLVLGVPLVAILDFTGGTLFYRQIREARIAYVDAKQAETGGRTLTTEQTAALAAWRDIELRIIPNREDVKAHTRKMKSDYATVASHIRPLALQWQTTFIPLMLWDSLALMLLGLALYRWGFLTGAWSDRDYWRVLLIGYGIGLPLVCYSFYHSYRVSPNLDASLARMLTTPVQWTAAIYPFQRILLVMAHASALILAYKAGLFRPLFKRLEAVGQMAMTNYVVQSIICTLVFFGYGLNWFAELEFYQLMFVVLAIWALQLLVSPLWLRAFLFGPFEWLWRSLTYQRLQPFRRTVTAASQPLVGL
jgi:uncharacterized protein